MQPWPGSSPPSRARVTTPALPPGGGRPFLPGTSGNGPPPGGGTLPAQASAALPPCAACRHSADRTPHGTTPVRIGPLISACPPPPPPTQLHPPRPHQPAFPTSPPPACACPLTSGRPRCPLHAHSVCFSTSRAAARAFTRPQQAASPTPRPPRLLPPISSSPGRAIRPVLAQRHLIPSSPGRATLPCARPAASTTLRSAELPARLPTCLPRPHPMSGRPDLRITLRHHASGSVHNSPVDLSTASFYASLPTPTSSPSPRLPPRAHDRPPCSGLLLYGCPISLRTAPSPSPSPSSTLLRFPRR